MLETFHRPEPNPNRYYRKHIPTTFNFSVLKSLAAIHLVRLVWQLNHIIVTLALKRLKWVTSIHLNHVVVRKVNSPLEAQCWCFLEPELANRWTIAYATSWRTQDLVAIEHTCFTSLSRLMRRNSFAKYRTCSSDMEPSSEVINDSSGGGGVWGIINSRCSAAERP